MKWEYLYKDMKGRIAIWSVLEDLRYGAARINSNKSTKQGESPLTHIKCNPYKKLPNCRAFKIKLSRWDMVVELFGIWTGYKVRKRLKPEIKIAPYTNGEINRFVEYSTRRLNRLAESKNPTFFKYAKEIIRRSDAHLIMAVNHVFPQWHRTQNLNSIMKWTKKVRKMTYSEPYEIEYKRKYIPKKGGWRPLGVPTPEWRIYLHMWQQIMTIWVYYNISSEQHGFVPQRGTLTAWKSLLSKINKYDYIYEFDLEKCFDKIRLDSQKVLMENIGIPKDFSTWFYRMNKSVPKFTKIMLDESRYFLRGKNPKELGFDVGWTKSKLATIPNPMELMQAIKENFYLMTWEAKKFVKGKSPLQINWAKVGWMDTQMDYSKDPKEEIKKYKSSNKYWYWKTGNPEDPNHKIIAVKPPRPNLEGNPQGSPLSPIFSLISLHYSIFKKAIKKAIYAIMYADDGLLLSKRKENFAELIENKRLGVNVNRNKSGLVKEAGIWLKELKFLGMVYNPWEETIRSDTRKGKSLKLTEDWEELIIQQDRKHGIYHKEGTKTWEMFIESKLSGFLQARMYSGSWGLEDLQQDFTLTYKRNSWTKKYREEGMTIFNSSSFASGWLYSQLASRKSERYRRLMRHWTEKQRKATAGWTKGNIFDLHWKWT